jgi:hypothetical protein
MAAVVTPNSRAAIEKPPQRTSSLKKAISEGAEPVIDNFQVNNDITLSVGRAFSNG